MKYVIGAVAVYLALTAVVCDVLGIGEPGLPVLPAMLAISLAALGVLPAGSVRR